MFEYYNLPIKIRQYFAQKLQEQMNKEAEEMKKASSKK